MGEGAKAEEPTTKRARTAFLNMVKICENDSSKKK
jgi:hypothetical protein